MTQYWRQCLRLTAALLGVWLVVTLVASYFARDLAFTVMGWPFSYWFSSQGALFIYLAIIGCYAHVMDKLEHDEDAGLHD